MRRGRLAAWSVLLLASGHAAAGCAAKLEAAAARHQARAVALDAAGDGEGALREREAANDKRDQLSAGVDAPTPLPPLTAF